jgi:valyl-tRNA synthetase
VSAEFEPIRVAAEVFRRAGVRAPLDGERQRIFDAVVKPDRAKVDGANVEAEAARLRGEIERAEKMLSNERFVQNAPGDVVEAEREKLERYRRELDALGV